MYMLNYLVTYEYMIIHNLADNNLMQKYKG